MLLIRSLILFCISYCSAFAIEIDTFYGKADINEPVLIELIESPAFQRLKHIHQYGVAYYTTHHEEYTRYDHSLGVFLLLRSKGCCLKEQIAGLLHDVSHTIFSHVGDWVFRCEYQEVDYQTSTHSDYLAQSGLGDILNRYGYSIEEVLPKEEQFPALEKPLPTLCADRLDYNIQGAFYQGFITLDEAKQLFEEIQLIDDEWISSEYEILKKLMRYSIFMSQDCWGSGEGHVLSMWLAEAIWRAVNIGMISVKDIHFGTDQEVWDLLLSSDDPVIREKMQMIQNSSRYQCYTSKEEANLLVKAKFRGIDPWVILNKRKVRLTNTDPTLAEEFHTAKNRMANGWAIKIKTKG